MLSFDVKDKEKKPAGVQRDIHKELIELFFESKKI